MSRPYRYQSGRGPNDRLRESRIGRPLALEPLEVRCLLATVTLNTDTGAPGELRTEVANAASGATIEFNLGVGNETIVLDPALGELRIDKDLTIDGDNAAGSGVDVTISGGNNSRVIQVSDGNNATADLDVLLSNLTITGGRAELAAGIYNAEHLTLVNSTVSGNTATAGPGGGIRSFGYDSRLHVIGSIIDSNAAYNISYRHGGGISVNLGSLLVEDSTISNNSAFSQYSSSGGGISVQSAFFGYTYASAPIDAIIRGSVVTGNVTSGRYAHGGGVFAGGLGQITIEDSVISNNSSVETTLNSVSGGGLGFYSLQESLSVVIERSQISANSTTGSGGGISAFVRADFSGSIDVVISGSNIDNNLSDYWGGGLWQRGQNARVTTQITNASITGNTARASGGLTTENAYLLLESSVVSGNQAIGNGNNHGGGVSAYGSYLYYASQSPPTLVVRNSTISGNQTQGNGGGIYALNAELDVVQSTVSGNTARGEGAGIFVYSSLSYVGTPYEATTHIEQSTITQNIGTQGPGRGGGGLYVGYYHRLFSLRNSIIAGNTHASGGPDVYAPTLTGNVTANTYYSLIGNNQGSGFVEANPGPDGNGNIVGTPSNPADAMLGPLGDNGGPTPTHLPMSGSLSIDAADPYVSPGKATDQRGFERVIDGNSPDVARMDMGSVEFRSGPIAVDGDFNYDGLWNCEDIDALSAAVAAGSTDLSFDMNGDGMITSVDITDPTAGWLTVGGANNPTQTNGNTFLNGDANLDGVVDGQDFIIWNGNKFTNAGRWCLGDFNQDNVVDGQDFIIWNANKFTSSRNRAVPGNSAVPTVGTSSVRPLKLRDHRGTILEQTQSMSANRSTVTYPRLKAERTGRAIDAVLEKWSTPEVADQRQTRSKGACRTVPNASGSLPDVGDIRRVLLSRSVKLFENSLMRVP